MRTLKRFLYAALLSVGLASPAMAEPLWSGPGNTGLANARVNLSTLSTLLVHFGYRDADGTPTWYMANGNNGGDADLFKGDTVTCRDGQPFGGAYRAPTCDVFGFLSVEWASSQNGATYGIDVDKIGTLYLSNDRAKYASAITPTVVEAGPGGGPAARNPSKDYHPAGWYWRPTEGGEGWFYDVQGDTAFLAIFTYGTDGRNTWKISTGTMTSVTSFAGQQLACQKSAGTVTCLTEGTLNLIFRTVDNGFNNQGVSLNTACNTKVIDVTVPSGKQFTLDRFLTC